ncbi:efflux RND transporter periplasmic adaptor subunit [Paraferrimonas sedimenticola]|uniref:Hemolysin secretion protein D n=1 Tax=Paraferrimonas sedimenticola TaxID=375674 RepID=A0AA37RU60_9GAMM|nr:efflux RND transporter periplasmic adaptor subunit [Paraferrimonas sedimenticola]GLP95208.1 hemolysin secretion protein D [Paraferrimonas sedimenticola]
MKRFALLLTITTGLITGCGPAAEQTEVPDPAVTVFTVNFKDVRQSAEFVGRVQASEDVNIRSRVEGPLLERKFTEGEEINAGDLLFEIDPATYEAKLAQSQAALKQAIAARDVAEINWKRGKALAPDGLISGKDMDDLTTNKIQSEAAVVEAEAALESTRLQLEYTKVYAPIKGRISRTLVSLGDLITPQTDMATLVQTDPMWVNFQVSERAATDAQILMQSGETNMPKLNELIVKLRLPNENIYDQPGKLDFVSNRIDPATGTLGLRATFSNPGGLLIAGMFVNVIIEAPDAEPTLLVPQASVQEDQQGRFVMVVDSEGMVQKRLVELGRRVEIMWEVIDGLKDGERVVMEGLQKIRPGIKVQTSEADVMPFQQKAS